MKKFFSLFFMTSLFAGQALAKECKLVRPLPFHGTSLEGLSLHAVKLDSTPRFYRPESYDPAKDSLVINLFGIQWNHTRTGFLGLRLVNPEKFQSIGFSPEYSGNFNFEGGTTTVNGSKTYHTRTMEQYSESQHAHNQAVTEATIKTRGNLITSLEMTFPVFRVWKTEAGVDYIAFTGQHQHLCVLEAR